MDRKIWLKWEENTPQFQKQVKNFRAELLGKARVNLHKKCTVPRDHAGWSNMEYTNLKKCVSAGFTLEEIAKEHGRTESAIINACVRKRYPKPISGKERLKAELKAELAARMAELAAQNAEVNKLCAQLNAL